MTDPETVAEQIARQYEQMWNQIRMTDDRANHRADMLEQRVAALDAHVTDIETRLRKAEEASTQWRFTIGLPAILGGVAGILALVISIP